MRLSLTFIIFGLATVVSAAPRPLNAEAREIGYTEALRLHETGALATRAGGAISAGPNPSSSDQVTAAKKKNKGKNKKKNNGKEKKKDNPQEDSAADKDKDDRLKAVLSCTGGGRALSDSERVLVQIQLNQFLNPNPRPTELPVILIPIDLPQYYAAQNVGAGGQTHEIINFQFTHPKCGKGKLPLCRGFLYLSTNGGKVFNEADELIYSRAASEAMKRTAWMKTNRSVSQMAITHELRADLGHLSSFQAFPTLKPDTIGNNPIRNTSKSGA
ncbi:hypothetical protein F5876DRAFT_77621 [Lentinula aff. lateritia]|uniref:Uncharacterized protein n=1 Tax=Lentinula aff. lateritia TaxID=2804960 RepID=A0ACC1TYD5_9AGAR|nr:hypothetical protein F5876DRAFT_77621 [Lentinula aff. lateritia]